MKKAPRSLRHVLAFGSRQSDDNCAAKSVQATDQEETDVTDIDHRVSRCGRVGTDPDGPG